MPERVEHERGDRRLDAGTRSVVFTPLPIGSGAVATRREERDVLLHGVRIRLGIEVVVLTQGPPDAADPHASIRLTFQPLDPPCARPVQAAPADLTRVNILTFQPLRTADERTGRFVVSALLRQLEALYERHRQQIRGATGLGTLIWRERLLGATPGRAMSILGTFDWHYLLSGTRCGATCRDTIVLATTLNHPTIRPVTRPTRWATEAIDVVIEDPVALGRRFEIQRRIDGLRHHRNVPDIELDRIGLMARRQLQARQEPPDNDAEPRRSAIERLRRWCGDDIADGFIKGGGVEITQSGYRFTLREGQFVDCRAPNGAHARLCIHSANFHAHPIDEMTFQCLQIRSDVDRFLHTANQYSADVDFPRLPGR